MENANKKCKNKDLKKNPKNSFFLMSQGSLNPKKIFSQKACFVTRPQIDTHTDTHESEYRGNPFRVSGMFPSTCHQGSVQIYSRKLDM